MNVNSVVSFIFTIVFSCFSQIYGAFSPTDTNIPRVKVTSPVFRHGEPIPKNYTGEGDNISPPIEWGKVPVETKSIAIICKDSDAKKVVGKTFVHWIIYNIPPEYNGLSKDIPTIAEPRTTQVLQHARQGKNSFGKIGYKGPMPPPEQEHRYVFLLFALDEFLKLEPGATKKNLLGAMQKNILGYGELMGTYKRQKTFQKDKK